MVLNGNTLVVVGKDLTNEVGINALASLDLIAMVHAGYNAVQQGIAHEGSNSSWRKVHGLKL